MSDATAPIAAAAASAVVTSQAGFSISRFETWTRRHAILFVGFAAGVLFVIPLSHILPKALGIMPAAANFAPLGFFALGTTHLAVNRLSGNLRAAGRIRSPMA